MLLLHVYVTKFSKIVQQYFSIQKYSEFWIRNYSDFSGGSSFILFVFLFFFFACVDLPGRYFHAYCYQSIFISYTYSHIKVIMHYINNTQTTQLWRQNMEWRICIKTCFLLEIYSKTLQL